MAAPWGGVPGDALPAQRRAHRRARCHGGAPGEPAFRHRTPFFIAGYRGEGAREPVRPPPPPTPPPTPRGQGRRKCQRNWVPPPASRGAGGGAGIPASRSRPAPGAGWERGDPPKSPPRVMPSRVTSDPSPAPCARPGHRHRTGSDGDRCGLLAEAPPRPPPCPVPPPRGARPGGEPLCRGPGSGLAPPGAEELYFCTETFPAGAPFTLRDRGRHRLRERRWRRAQAVPAATRPAPLTHPGAAPPKPPGAAGLPRGRRLLPAPLRRTSRAGGRREHLGKRGPGPACVGCSPSRPQPQRGPRGGTGTPAPEPRGWPRPRPVRLGNRASPPRSASGTA